MLLSQLKTYPPAVVQQILAKLALNEAERDDLLDLVKARDYKASRRKFEDYYPDTGPLRRELYVKHIAFFEAGQFYRERLCLAANRIGKTEGIGGYELTCHLTGKYPEWWPGKKFTRPIKAWAAGDTSQTVRDILQAKLVGPIDTPGTGLIPGELIFGKPRRKAGSVPDCIETVRVRHHTNGIYDGCSLLTFKSYDQGRVAFQGTEQDVILLDEEPPLPVYTECTIRTMTVNGLVLCTFTPLEGLSETVLTFLPDGKVPEKPGEKNGKFVIGATWDDAPHLTEEQKTELWKSIPPYQRDARSKGIPQLGSGAIYPIPEDQIWVPDFEIPVHWPRCFSLDVGWNWTAASWFAFDRDNDLGYITSVYKRGEAEPSVHADAIKARGKWIPGVIDPSSKAASVIDGRNLLDIYTYSLGLDLTKAENSVEAGIYATWLALSLGKLKVFKSCTLWFEEFRLYRRDEKGKIVKINDHLMDTTRYGEMSGLQVAIPMPFEDAYPDERYQDDKPRDDMCGY